MPCGPICPASDALCIAGFKQASACQPPTREICCIGPGIVDSVEQDLYIMFTYKYNYILKAWIFFSCAVLTQSFQQGRLARSFSGNSAPISAKQGRKSAPFAAKPFRRKSVPNLGRAWGESNLRPFGCRPVRLQLGQVRAASTAIHLHLLHSHRPPPRPDRSQNPKSKLQTGRLGFGFWSLKNPNSKRAVWVLDFGVWSLDFGVWILDFGSWILDFGSWILDFGPV